ncbi:hypothetical protein AB6A40_003730 [Gnathostoma spinigerum]|uniref:Uncharacterized protein n=1 Tax=Gnathostoma spinigerum TaxID=75299 RepID=A0ABD6EI05_9BILA
MHGVWRHWAPPMERSKLATTAFAGAYLGVMLGLPVSAYLVTYIDWSAPFYFFGVSGIIWLLLWVYISAPSPITCKHISEDERQFITENVGRIATSQTTLTTIPWKRIFLSLPVWAIVVCNFCRSWTFFLMLGNQLTYMSDVLHLEIHNGGWISSLPHIVMTIVLLASGQIADYLRSTGKLSTTMVRKLFTVLGFSFEAAFLCGLAFVTQPVLAVTMLVLGVGLGGFNIAGFNVNHFDIAPRYAPILMGFSNGVGALAGISGLVSEHLTADGPAGWRTCFLLAMCIDLVGLITFVVFGSGELQDWAKEVEPQQSTEEIVRRLSSAIKRVSSIRGSSFFRRSYAKKDDQVSIADEFSRQSSERSMKEVKKSELSSIREADV